MILNCPSCATRWTVNSTDLANPGRMVRCSNCGHTWLPDLASDEAALPEFFSATPEPATPGAARPKAGAPDAASIVRPPPGGKSMDEDFDAFLNAPISSGPGAAADLPPMDFLAAMADAAADAKTSPASNESIIARSLFAMDDDEDEPSVPAKSRPSRALPPAEEMVSAGALRDKIKTAEEEFSDFTPPPLNPPIKGRKAAKANHGAAPRRSAGSPLGWALLLLIFSGTIAGLYFGRTQIVETWPPAAVAYARAGLPVGFPGEGFDLANVASTRRDDVGMLIIEGRVLNTTNSAKPAPKLKAIVSGANDQVLKEWIFAGTPPTVAPNSAEAFKVELKDLPQAADKLVVTFAE
ncbi:MJ0042-type zinc finger domain-containing protein [Elstera sp.]|uniref:MJ0042-type zinc finger domain-containing protein n=1 Tax=Elstera sp. TaxID=1916664 RepID=UPI0037C11B13